MFKLHFKEKIVTVQAIRTNCFSGKGRLSGCEFMLKKTDKWGWIVHIVSGGVTGWEYFSAEKNNLKEKFSNGWTACLGRHGEWDKLFITGDQMLKALDKLGIIPDNRR